MDFLWWQLCLIELSKGLAWTLPIGAFFFGVVLIINWLLKDDAEKAKRVISRKDK